MRTHRAESAKSPKRPPPTAKAASKKKTAQKAAPRAKKKISAASSRDKDLVSHENDLFDEEEDFESPRRNPSQLRPSEMEEEDRPRKVKRNRSSF